MCMHVIYAHIGVYRYTPIVRRIPSVFCLGVPLGHEACSSCDVGHGYGLPSALRWGPGVKVHQIPLVICW